MIYGYAAYATGASEYNKELSLKRAKAVIDMLVDQFGIATTRIKANADGGVDSFGQPMLNRVAIIQNTME